MFLFFRFPFKINTEARFVLAVFCQCIAGLYSVWTILTPILMFISVVWYIVDIALEIADNFTKIDGDKFLNRKRELSQIIVFHSKVME